jgi:serralysin
MVADTGGASGQGGTSATVTASGNQLIDGLLTGVKWAGGSITYTDPDAAGDYQPGYFVDVNGNSISAQNEGFSHISAGQLLAVHYALNVSNYTQPLGAAGFSVEGFTGLDITYGGANLGTGTIRVANTSDNLYGYTYYPANSIYGGDAWMGTNIRSPVQGNYDWNNTIHELGHALGLKHGHEAGGPANVALPADHDSLEFTVMTYRSYIGAPLTGYTNGTWDYPQTYMMLDIQALQYMYGADFSVNSGDTTYTWSPTTGQSFVDGNLATNPGSGIGGAANRIFMTIWDGGGVDTYDLSNYTTSMTIDLRPGEWSTFDAAQLANLDGVGGHMARGNVANALQYSGDGRSLIENASGGSGNDTLTGNDIANVLNGNDGNDLIDGNGGNDFVNGNGGNDRFLMQTFDGIDNFNGGAGSDRIDFSGLLGFVVVDLVHSLWRFNGGTSGDAIDIEKIIGTAGADTLVGNSARNLLSGGNGNDMIKGGGGNDHLFGNVGDDVMKGFAGNDFLTGGIGKDTLTGGFDRDRFVFGAPGVSTVALAGRDLITDFHHGQHDRMDVSDIDAHATAGGDQAFSFIGTHSFTHHEGELRYRFAGGDTIVTGDVNGDGTADFAIELAGKRNLVEGDFLL